MSVSKLPTVIYSHRPMAHPPPKAPTSFSDSVNSFPPRLMSHEFTLLTPLHRFLASCSLPTSLSFSIIITVKATEACRGGTDFSTKGLSKPADISGEFSRKLERHSIGTYEGSFNIPTVC